MKKELLKSASVIIASYNRKNLFQRNLEALNGQKFKGDLEIIVIDDGSNNNFKIAFKFLAIKSF